MPLFGEANAHARGTSRKSGLAWRTVFEYEPRLRRGKVPRRPEAKVPFSDFRSKDACGCCEFINQTDLNKGTPS